MTVAVRFAPSPTGRLHVGNARAAVLNWLFARQAGGKFVLRLDDTDRERSTQTFAEGIETDLKWLRLTHDSFARQSDRFELYAAAAERLKKSGRLYPAYEAADELDRKRARQRARHLPPIYDRAALHLSDEDRVRLETEGRRPHWRFRLNHQPVAWVDLVRGPVSIDTSTLSDPILIREDGQFLYTLPSVVDDIDLGISHVIRGEDHVVNTAAQIEIFEALGGVLPQFAHYPLILGPDGEPLSKRIGSLSLASMREGGIDPMAVNSLLAKVGTSDPIEPRLALDELAAEFSFAKISHAAAKLDPDDLRRLSTKLLHLKPFDDISARLGELGITADEAFWLAVRDNLECLEQAVEWWAIVSGVMEPAVADPVVTRAAIDSMPDGPLTEEIWGPWTKATGQAAGRKGRELFMPLRLALTGREHGPELKKLLPLIGRERALARLRGERA